MRRRFGMSPDKFPLENPRIQKSVPAWPRSPICTQERDQILDPDVAVVTTIGIDHTAWLGDTRDWIAAEKAGIFRSHRPASWGIVHPAGALLERSETLGCDLFVLGRDFDWEDEGPTWRWSGPESIRTGLPAPALRGIFQRDNAATVLMAVACLNPRLPVAIPHLGLGLRQTHLPGRFQIVPARCSGSWMSPTTPKRPRCWRPTYAPSITQAACMRCSASCGTKTRRPLPNPWPGRSMPGTSGKARIPGPRPAAELRARLEGLAADRALHTCGGITEALGPRR